MTQVAETKAASTRAEVAPLVKLAIPLMIGLAAALLIGVVDTIMISPLGTIPLAAAGITTAVLIILISALWGIVTVISVEISQADGAGDTKAAAKAVRGGLQLCLIGGGSAMLIMLLGYLALGPLGQPEEVLDILFPYWAAMALWIIPFTLFFGLKSLFDAVNWPWTAVILSYLGVIINVPANYAFIHILDLGLVGAGLASVLSQTCSLVAAWFVFRYADGLSEYRQSVAVAWGDVLAQAKSALPICIGYAGEGGAYAVIGIMMGWLGSEALAAHQIVNAFGGLAYMIPLGMAGAASIRVGQAFGAKSMNRLRPILKASFVMVTGWQIVAAFAFIIGGQYLAESMSSDPKVIALAVYLFLIVALMQIADGLQGTALGALRGMSDMNWPTTITLVAYWLFAIPVSFLLGFTFDLGAIGIWIGYTLGLVVAAVALPWRFWLLTASD